MAADATSTLNPVVAGDEEGQYLLIHLDGVSSRVFSSELRAGNLENLREYFGDDGIIEQGVTFYPPFTSVAVMRVREGREITEAEVIDWDAYDRDEGEALGQGRVMLEYLRTMPRRARSNVLHGTPIFHYLAGPALRNVPDHLDRYHSTEFYWFSTDTFGHIWGEDELRRELRRFDRAFGRMAGNLPEDLNVIIYADHGMGFGEAADYDSEVRDFARDEFGEDVFEYFAYPNLYLHDEEKAEEVARRVARETAQDFAFYRESEERVVGYTPDARLVFEWGLDGLRYEYDGPSDPLAYDGEVAYAGAYLPRDQWLELTAGRLYPYAPVRIFELFQSEHVGEVVTVLNDPKVKSGGWVFSGNHHGLTSDNMAVPILVRGPGLEGLRGRTSVRVEDVMAEAPLERIEKQRPSRDDHQMSVWQATGDGAGALGADAVFSPRYRWRVGGEMGVHRTDQAFALFDLTSGYLSRLWVGGGVSHGDRTRAAAFVDYEFKVRRLGMNARLSTAGDARWDLFVLFRRGISLQLRNLESIGVRMRF